MPDQPPAVGDMDAFAGAEPQYVIEPPPAASNVLDPHPAPQADDETPETAPLVLVAVAFGFAPIPFLALYTLVFLLHGLFVPVQPPDITRTRGGESLAGFITLALTVIGCVALAQFVGRRRRWPFVLTQLATLGAALYFLSHSSSGPHIVPGLLLVTSLSALVLAFAPASWAHLGQRPPALRTWLAALRLPRRPRWHRGAADPGPGPDFAADADDT